MKDVVSTDTFQKQLKTSKERQKKKVKAEKKKTQVLKIGGDQSGLLSKINLTNTKPMLVALISISTNVKITKL